MGKQRNKTGCFSDSSLFPKAKPCAGHERFGSLFEPSGFYEAERGMKTPRFVLELNKAALCVGGGGVEVEGTGATKLLCRRREQSEKT